MKYPVYSVKDSKSGFQTPFCDINDNTAERGFAFALHQSGSVMSYSPKDYDLFRVSEFDTDTGKMEKLEFPVLVVDGVSAFDRSE